MNHYFQMHGACVRLITEGNAYADDSSKEHIKIQRRHGIASARRSMSIADSLQRFEDMRAGRGLHWCIRARISVDDPNKAVRDPVLCRCNLRPHHRTGTTWKIYRTYDFCAPFLGSAEGVTHALRTSEYRDMNAQYRWIQRALDLRQVDIWDFSGLSFVRTVLSKRKLATLVDNGVAWGWDDPRMPTVRGVRRRGMTIPALRELILKQGPSQNLVNLDWTTFWAINKKHIDPVAPRYTAIRKQDAVTATVQGVDGLDAGEKPTHAKNPALGSKRVVYGKGILLNKSDAQSFHLNEEVTLMNWGNAIIRAISANPSTGKVDSIQLELHLSGDFKKTDKKIAWLATDPANLIPIELVEFDHLLAKDKLKMTILCSI